MEQDKQAIHAVRALVLVAAVRKRVLLQVMTPVGYIVHLQYLSPESTNYSKYCVMQLKELCFLFVQLHCKLTEVMGSLNIN